MSADVRPFRVVKRSRPVWRRAPKHPVWRWTPKAPAAVHKKLDRLQALNPSAVWAVEQLIDRVFEVHRRSPVA